MAEGARGRSPARRRRAQRELTLALLLRFRRNLLLKVATDVIAKGFTFVFVLAVAKRLGREDFGVYTAAQGIAAMAAIAGDLGLNLLVTREVAARRDEAPRLVGNLVTIKLALSGVVLLIVAALTRLENFADIAGPLVLMGLFMVFWSALEFISSVFCGFERMEWEIVLKGSGRLLMVLFGLGALVAGRGLQGVLAGMALGPGVVLAGTLVVARLRAPQYRPRWDGPVIRRAAADALALSVLTVMVTLFVRVDVFLLEYLRGDHAEIGNYGAAVRIIDALGGVALLFSSALYPMYADLYRTRRDALRVLGQGALRLMALLALPVVAVGIAGAHTLVRLLYGAEFAESADALVILLLQVPAFFANMQISSLLIAAGRQRSLAAIAGGVLLFNLALGFLLIPPYGFRGAALSTVLTETLLLVLMASLVLPRAVSLGFPRFLWRFGLAGAAMGAVLWSLGATVPWLAAALAVALYLGGLYALGEFRREDLERLRRLARPKAPEPSAVA